MFGSTKNGEYYRTIDMLVSKTGKTEKEVMHILYFLYDSQYDNKDLKAMADLIANKKKMNKIETTKERFNRTVDELLIDNGCGYTVEEDLLFDSGVEVIFLDNEEEYRKEMNGIKEHMKSYKYENMDILLTINERIAVILN